jgi:hypothetical protein
VTVKISDALLALRPGAEWVLRGNEYSGIEWIDTVQTKPTEEEVNAEVARLEAKYIANEYQRLRAAEYPSFADQFDTLYHGGLDAWKATIDVVKQKYPKPE